LHALGDRVRYAEADFADPDAPRAVVAAACAAFGRVDLLIVNHARSGHGRLADITAPQLDAFLHENVRAMILLVKEFAAQHDGRPGGRVVLLTSGQHLAPMKREVAYAISKGALHQATRTLADELIDRGITVNTVNPGPTDTGWDISSCVRSGLTRSSPRTAPGRSRNSCTASCGTASRSTPCTWWRHSTSHASRGRSTASWPTSSSAVGGTR
jgi:NAD(P)-dependent dehydrogenase (short-subunit alcohol dehydrogenase family)